MDKMINFGIDLGTTNSVIAKFIKGKIEVFSDPSENGRQTLPSIVYYKKDKTVVGGQAKTYLEREEPTQVFSRFKRLLGTTETKRVKILNVSKTPVELSAEVLKELKTFVHSGEQVDAAVITIPASFNIPQSNATSEAGYLAGFKQVILLPEPIAASLAYAINQNISELENKQWLVYDFGGGTFDVALVKIKDGELKVLDHEGNNFLGGAEFDDLIVDKIIAPYLNKHYKFTDLEKKMKSASGDYNSFYYRSLFVAEKAKISLSNKASAEIELTDITDEKGEKIDESFDITRSEFESLIKETIDDTIDMIKKILVRNSLHSSDIQFTLMVGGSTYIPYVRKRVEEILQIPVNCSINPTTAVAIGAAYFAGTKEKNVGIENTKKSASGLKIRFAYNKTSTENEEILTGKFDGNTDGLFYRIKREDNGFDTGVKPLSQRISEDLQLVKDGYNYFKFTILDAQNNIVDADIDLIGISPNINPGETPLANDICIEIDEDRELINAGTAKTKLLSVFYKNTFLPQKKTITRYLTKSILKDTNEKVILNILEGSHTNLPAANLTIGYMEIKGTSLPADVYKNDEVEIKIEISSNREIKASVYFIRINREFSEVYKGILFDLPVSKFKDEITLLNESLEIEIKEAIDREEYTTADELTKLQKKVDGLAEISNNMTDDDSTDRKIGKIEEKRKIAQEIDEATKTKRIAALKKEYASDKEWCKKIVDENGNDQDRKMFNDIIIREQVFLTTTTPVKIKEAIDDLNNLGFNILWRTPSWLEAKFYRLIEKPQLFNEQSKAKSLIEAGHLYISNKNYDSLKRVNFDLIDLLPDTLSSSRMNDKDIGGTAL